MDIEGEGDGVLASEDSRSADYGFLGTLKKWGDFGNGGVLMEVGEEEGVVSRGPGSTFSGGGIRVAWSVSSAISTA